MHRQKYNILDYSKLFSTEHTNNILDIEIIKRISVLPFSSCTF